MPYLYPLASFLLPILAVYSVAVVYRSIYPYEAVREAVASLAEYRMLSRMRSKRAVKRARQLAPQAREARRLLLRALLFKTAMLIGVFAATSILVLRTPLAYSPFDLPPLTLSSQGGEPLVYTSFIHLAGYIYALLLFRDYLL
ncbi:hypothetical protein [Stetteria hydrogenophila]